MAKKQRRKPQKETADIALNKVDDLARFIRECILTETENDEHFSRLIVRHLIRGNQVGDEVAFYKVTKRPTDDYADSQAREIYDKLTLEAETLKGYQKWAVYAYLSSDEENHFGRHLIRIQGDTDEDDNADEIDTEGPTERGIRNQQMRHNEVLAKTLVASQANMTSAFSTIISRQNQMISTMMDSQMDVLSTLRELHDDKRTKETEENREQIKADALKRTIDLLGPVVINKLAGKQVVPVNGKSVMMQTRSLLSSITGNEEKMKALSAILAPDEMACLVNLYDEVSTATHEDNNNKKEGD